MALNRERMYQIESFLGNYGPRPAKHIAKRLDLGRKVVQHDLDCLEAMGRVSWEKRETTTKVQRDKGHRGFTRIYRYQGRRIDEMELLLQGVMFVLEVEEQPLHYVAKVRCLPPPSARDQVAVGKAVWQNGAKFWIVDVQGNDKLYLKKEKTERTLEAGRTLSL